VLRHLNEIKVVIGTLGAWWNVTGTVYGHGHPRERRPDEYPEAQRLYWASTIAKIDDMSEMLETLRAHCLAEYHATPEDESK